MKHLATIFGSRDGGCHGNDSLGCRCVGVVWGPTVSIIVLWYSSKEALSLGIDYRVYTGLGKLQMG